MKVILVTLAMNQTTFLCGVAKSLYKKGIKSDFISFHEPSKKYIEEQGFECYSPFDYFDATIDNSSIDEHYASWSKKLNIDNPQVMLSHEKVAFNIKNDKDIKYKFCQYFIAIEKIIKEIKKIDDEIVFLHELGGFSSIISTFYLTQYYNIPNVFIEPSFFRGRTFFVKNSLLALKIKEETFSTYDEELIHYLEETLESKSIVIPKKDLRGYNNVINKILNLHNIKRFFQKLIDKYLFNRKEEFSYIGFHVKKHIYMFFKQLYFSNEYQNIPQAKFIYYPFHVPNDVALTIRSPQYLDQIALVDYIARVLPLGYKLVVKEHPAMIGAMDFNKLKCLLKDNNNIILLHPSINNFEVLSNADSILTVNSKAGAEAMLLKKSVYVLGDAFYCEASNVNMLNCITEVPRLLATVKKNIYSDENNKNFFQCVWNESYPGELYYDTDENFDIFTKSILEYFNKEGIMNNE